MPRLDYILLSNCYYFIYLQCRAFALLIESIIHNSDHREQKLCYGDGFSASVLGRKISNHPKGLFYILVEVPKGSKHTKCVRLNLGENVYKIQQKTSRIFPFDEMV